MNEPFTPEEQPLARAFDEVQAPPGTGDYRRRAAASPGRGRSWSSRPLMAAIGVAIAGALSLSYFGLHLAGQPAGSASLPPARGGAAMAYDQALRKVVLFGGATGAGGSSSVLTDTWAFDGTQWTQLHPSSSPPALINMQMAYDPQSQLLVLSGTAMASGGNAASTCQASAAGSVCSSGCIGIAQASPQSITPGGVSSGGAVAGSAAGSAVAGSPPAGGGIVCRSTLSPPSMQLWTFDGSAWKKIDSPFSAGDEIAMGTDWKHGQLVAVSRSRVLPMMGAATSGGVNSAGVATMPCHIPPRTAGINTPFTCLPDGRPFAVYVFKGDAFSPVGSIGVSPPTYSNYSTYTAVYDNGSDALELIPDSSLSCFEPALGAPPAGATAAGATAPCLSDAKVMVWNGTIWSELSNSKFPVSLGLTGAVSAPGGVILFSSGGSAQFWTAGQDPKEISLAPGPRHNAALTFDRDSSAAMLFGGTRFEPTTAKNITFISGGESAPGNDTWLFTAGAWTRVSGETPPSPTSIPVPTVCPLGAAQQSGMMVSSCPPCGPMTTSNGAGGISVTTGGGAGYSVQGATGVSAPGPVVCFGRGGGGATPVPAPTPPAITGSPAPSPSSTDTPAATPT